ncbi:YbaB/EbfC family nucleoid-associated protein [Nocardia mangyaensis]|uniref:YbaB/EbfC family nucleoid-associated protein n=1 Tax=Nocardia mangyaensis TaxID=2213200 RepID=UPI0026773E30|nr:YbaB/EbfC family nucleoid-associated protein [Nocardia mangyaensis]MDO3647143.1 YbaB/EbfC family nucleoid-associated protein [Nocardia mangyaensis]
MSAEMDALVKGVTDKLEALEAALYGLKQVNGRFTTEDGLVTAEVNSDGALVALTLDEGITALAPPEAAQLILHACKQATEGAGAQRSNIIATLNESLTGSSAVPADQLAPGPDSARR